MSRKKRQDKELIMLSAYLDSELIQADRKRLEKRLEREPALRERLDNLRRTKIILGGLSRLKPPHNFTLTPEMVAVRHKKRNPLFSFLKLASSFAAILLVVLVGIELVLGGMGARMPMTAEAPVMEADSSAEEATPEPLILWDDSASGGGGGAQKSDVNRVGGGVEEESEILEYPESEQTGPTEEPVEGSILSEEVVEEALVEEKAAGEEALILGINSEESGEIVARSEPAQQEEDGAFNQMSPVRWIEVALAAIAIIGGLIYFVLHKR